MRINLLVTILFAVSATAGASQELKSRYNLKKTKIFLVNGLVQRGNLIGITADSLILEDKNVAPPGSEVYIRRHHTDQAIRVVVNHVSDTVLMVTRVENQAILKIKRETIDKLSIIECPLSAEGLKHFQQHRIHYSTIRHIALHKKNAGALGCAAGFVTGVGILVAATSSNGYVAGEYLVAGAFFGMGIGAAIATTNKKFMVDGDREKFRLAREKIVQ